MEGFRLPDISFYLYSACANEPGNMRGKSSIQSLTSSENRLGHFLQQNRMEFFGYGFQTLGIFC